MPIFCQKCAARNNDNALVCRVCGTEFTGNNGEQSQGGRTAFYLVAGTAIAVLILTALSPLQSTRSFVSSIEARIGLAGGNQTQNSSISSSTSLKTTLSTSIPTTKPTTTMAPTTTVPHTTEITAVNSYINFADNQTNSSSSTASTSPGFNVTAGTYFPFTLMFSNSGANSVIVENITTVTPGFNVTRVTPQLPEIVTPGSSISITTILKSPNETSYIGTLTIEVTEKAYYPANSTANTT